MTEPTNQTQRQAARMRGAGWVTLVFLLVYAVQQILPMLVAFWDAETAASLRAVTGDDPMLQLALPLILGYWLGSSEGSAIKTRLIAGKDGPRTP